MRHSRRNFLRLSGIGLAAAGAPAWARAADKKRPPNIVYIMSDELGYYELSCMGNPHLKTPHIDRLAREGTRFTQGLAGSSVCAPTRCCLMTGKHSGHTSVRSNGGGTPLREGEETVGSVLKSVGYATGGFGKWGCGGRGSTGVPEKHGFDIFYGYYDQVHAHSYYTPYLVKNSAEVPLKGNRGGSQGETYSHYSIVDEAFKFIRENKDRPFLCYLPITPPHGIFDIPDNDPAWALFKDQDWPEQAKRYAAMVNMVDRNVDEVRRLLAEVGVADNTVIFFCGDNGGADYFKDAEHPRGFFGANKHPKTGAEFRGKKGNLYEGGIRIPMIAHWPGRIAAGRVSDHLWYFPDVLPTLAEFAGAKTPADIDGISIVPELLGEKAAGRKQEQHEYLYWEIGRQTAVRMKNWKAIRPNTNAPWELYDLDQDISESNDLAEKQPDVLAKMTGFAEAAHEPVVEGTFHDREIHERDRQAKFGDTKQPAKPKRQPGKGKAKADANTRVEAMPQEGLIPSKDFKVARVSSEAGNGKQAVNAIDGKPGTWWHSDFSPKALEHPHELVIDLGAAYSVSGFRYMARQDPGWNGALKDCEFYVSDDPRAFAKLATKATFKKVKESQEATCKPVRGRYVLLKTLSAHADQPFATISELGIVGE